MLATPIKITLLLLLTALTVWVFLWERGRPALPALSGAHARQRNAGLMSRSRGKQSK